jgi:hypothetical protein
LLPHVGGQGFLVLSMELPVATHRKNKIRGPLRSVGFLAIGAAGAAAASTGLILSLPDLAAQQQPSSASQAQLTTFQVPLSPSTEPWWLDPIGGGSTRWRWRRRWDRRHGWHRWWRWHRR